MSDSLSVHIAITVHHATKGIIQTHCFYLSSTGYKQSVTGCGSQQSHVVVTQRKLM